MTRLLADTSVLVKWFHAEGEQEVQEARALRAAHVAGELDVHVLDLAVYEVGNVLLRALRWPAAEVSAQLDDLLLVLGTPLSMATDWFGPAARLGEEHGLSFYDAAWAAAAVELGLPLVSADRGLVRAGLAETPRSIVRRLRLS